MTSPRSWQAGVRSLAYKAAWRTATLVWRVLQIETHGAMVAVWHEDKILMVKNSYRTALSFPGGLRSRRDRKDSRVTAHRELVEEVGLHPPINTLKFHSRDRRRFEGHLCQTDIYELTLTAAPTLELDAKEIEAAFFLTPIAALDAPLMPTIRNYLAQKETRNPSTENADRHNITS